MNGMRFIAHSEVSASEQLTMTYYGLGIPQNGLVFRPEQLVEGVARYSLNGVEPTVSVAELERKWKDKPCPTPGVKGTPSLLPVEG